ncbi:MAG: hypothetical protein CK425_03690 [Parachlamydia sp.]|uniref:Uncharacterized protein n=1 Tax=Parachlamydia sp. TaxID=2052048 RepID=A0ACD6BA53_9BACT|nr:MAG: hypothetical protein CK425_03690 [Parachlamydia sp.]
MPKNIPPSQNSANWTFFNHYILFPKDAPSKELRQRNLIKSIVIGIPTLGLLHAGCALVYGFKKLKRRASKTQPSTTQKVENTAKTLFKPDLKSPPMNPQWLTEEQIKKMSPDEQGNLIDTYAARKINAASDLTHAQLRGMIGSTAASHIAIVNAQETGLGHCGRYAINNALQQEALSQNEFLSLTGQIFSNQLGMSLADVKNLIQNQDDFGIDTGVLAQILKQKFNQPVKESKICDLPDCALSKQQAVENYIGKAKWVIVANIGTEVFDMPSSTHAVYPLTRGHFVALRRDADNRWWYLDSRGKNPVNIALAIIPRTCTLIVPL